MEKIDPTGMKTSERCERYADFFEQVVEPVPEHFEIGTWSFDEVVWRDGVQGEIDLHRCGTEACVAGFLPNFFRGVTLHRGVPATPAGNRGEEAAMEILGISKEEAADLCYSSGYEQDDPEIDEAGDYVVTPKMVTARLRQLAAQYRERGK